MDIVKELYKNQDLGYKEFQTKLIPGINLDSVIGVRVPIIRNIAKMVMSAGNYEEFLKDLPHKYYEENMLHGVIISFLKDFNETVRHLDKFVDYIDNWAVNDIISPRSFKNNREEALVHIRKWLKSPKPYVNRFAIGMLMQFFLGDDFKKGYLLEVAKVKNDDYYVHMMMAWYYATALTKNYEESLFILEEGHLNQWIHNKTIQKAIESYRIPMERKEYLRSIKKK